MNATITSEPLLQPAELPAPVAPQPRERSRAPFIKRHAVLTYFVLTFAITRGGMIVVIGPGGFPGRATSSTT